MSYICARKNKTVPGSFENRESGVLGSNTTFDGHTISRVTDQVAVS